MSVSVDEANRRPAGRRSMVLWYQQSQDILHLGPTTVEIATKFLDGYVGSGKGKSREVLADRYRFQLAAITAFYMAVKINEPLELKAATLARLCNDYYSASDILSMEEDMLAALM